MPKVTINGREIDVPQGTTILAACEEAGIRVPYFCWHPALSIAGNCRMCLVEVEKFPKLVIACNTVVTEGMVVHTNSEKAKKAQQGVLEIMLVNHPLDCPICDQAGECMLQDRYFEFSLQKSRFTEEKIQKPKRKYLSDKIVFDGERCILCSRCVRFSDEISKESEIGIFERGAHSVVDIFPGKTLSSDYQLNMVDICPVGALTSADFRFKCRAWYLVPTAGVCTKCARGCSILVDHKGDEVHRYRPRKNPFVNGFWMCDEGRLSYKEIAGNRVTKPMVRNVRGKLTPVSWDEAVGQVVQKLKEIGGSAITAVASAYETNEANWALKKLFSGGFGSSHISGTDDTLGMGQGDHLLKKEDKTPNRTGLKRLGLNQAALSPEKVKALFLMGEDVSPEILGMAEFIVIATPYFNDNTGKAHVVLPSAHPAEQFGSYVNFEGRAQKTERAIAPPGEALPAYQILSKIGQPLSIKIPTCPAAIFKQISQDEPAFEGLSWQDLDPCGELTKA
jgi:NADH-quinone oxidoreductase subunit G